MFERSSRSAFLAGSAALAAAAPRAAAAQSTFPTLRVGAVPVEGYAQAFFGLELGLFQKAGLNVRTKHDHKGRGVFVAKPEQLVADLN